VKAGGHLCRMTDNTVWSHWQVASRSSEVNFTKNYTLLYLYLFTLDATRTPVSWSNGQRSRLEAGGGIPSRPNPAATLLVDCIKFQPTLSSSVTVCHSVTETTRWQAVHGRSRHALSPFRFCALLDQTSTVSHTKLMAITLSILNGFSKFFHRWKVK